MRARDGRFQCNGQSSCIQVQPIFSRKPQIIQKKLHWEWL